ncbi:MAG TPA: metallophosphoesterase [Oculatellaceae cyanobacterium]
MSLRQLAPQEIVGLVTVVSGVGYAYLHSGFLWICAFSGRKKAGLRWWEKGIMASSVVLTVCFLYALLIEPYWLEVTHVTIATPKISADNGDIRIVLISDLHCDKLVRLEPKLPSVIEKEHPDLILFAGDALNQISGTDNFKGCISALTKIAPTFIVEGNHDTRDFPFIKLNENTGSTLLRCAAVDVPIRRASLHLVGTSVDYERGLPRLLKKLNPNDFNIFLYHFPSEIVSISQYPVDLMLAGHTHGGQVCVPFYGAVITHSKTSKKYERGLYKLEDTWLYVNRGIGMDGGPTPRIRFLARPEVTVIDIKPDAKAKGNYRPIPASVDGFKPTAAKIP